LRPWNMQQLFAHKLTALAWNGRGMQGSGGHGLVFNAVGTTAYWQGEVFAVVWVVCILPMLFHRLLPFIW
ncbi:MAG: hypothetical protein M3Y39_09480, partial [Chloroflexota bacterium]|nr:hypothetical protein [Chloroflexota bacterium]